MENVLLMAIIFLSWMFQTIASNWPILAFIGILSFAGVFDKIDEATYYLEHPEESNIDDDYDEDDYLEDEPLEDDGLVI